MERTGYDRRITGNFGFQGQNDARKVIALLDTVVC